jgi:type IV secretory pathway VirB9-like protein
MGGAFMAKNCRKGLKVMEIRCHVKAAVVLASCLFLVGTSAQAQIVDGLLSPVQTSPGYSGGDGGAAREEIPIKELQPAWNKQTPSKADDQITAGIKKWEYSAYKAARLSLRLNATTSIYFPEWERIEYVVLGDRQYFQVAYPSEGGATGRALYRNVIELKPINNVVEADTSFTAFGSLIKGRRNVYTAWITSYPKTYDKTTDVTVHVVAEPPNDINSQDLPEAVAKSSGAAPAGAKGQVSDRNPPPVRAANSQPRPDANAASPANDFIREIAFDYANMKFGTYDIKVQDSDSRTIAPVRVMEDGIWTYIDFGENGRADRMLRPVAWRVVDGVDNLVNTRTVGPTGNILVVEGTGYNITLRNGERVVCLIYRGKDLMPGSGRADTASR